MKYPTSIFAPSLVGLVLSLFQLAMSKLVEDLDQPSHDQEKTSTSEHERTPENPLFNAHIDVSGVDERKLLRKMDLWLIPWLSVLYLLSFLDRTSIGNAKVSFDEAHKIAMWLSCW